MQEEKLAILALTFLIPFPLFPLSFPLTQITMPILIDLTGSESDSDDSNFARDNAVIAHATPPVGAIARNAPNDARLLTHAPRNTTMLAFTVPGKPKPLQRPQWVWGKKRGQRGRMVDPSSKDKIKFVRDSEAFLPTQDRRLQGAIEVVLEFYFCRPASHRRMANPPVYHNQVPDVDNLVKFVFDALNNKAYTDDSQVVAVHATKHWASTASTQVLIRCLP
jgi:crossover junction endodeoxyribonuclease RusA